jgi:hypothetical protein
MNINHDVVEAIGNTPLIKLKQASEATGCTILGKAEFESRTVGEGSCRKQMILEAEKRGDLKRGGLVVEGTAGNTGIGLAVVANARGYRTLIVIPETKVRRRRTRCDLWRRLVRSRRALPQSEQLPAHRRATPISFKSGPTAFCLPISGTIWIIPRRTTFRPAPKYGSRPAARSTGLSARSVPAGRWRA